MKKIFPVKKYRSYLPAMAATVLLTLFGVLLFIHALPEKDFSDELLITDCIWLDSWALAFFLVVVAVWISNVSRQVKSRLLLALFSLYGFITVCLILDGTSFGINAYWGDQKFRTAMLMKFTTFFGWPDFYYKDLPAFYPPVYYFLLSLYARVFSVEAFKMIKIGTMLIYLVGPVVLYMFWRKLVSPMQALLVTVFTFLFCSVGKNLLFLAPHAFIANSLFIPWWLYYVERVTNPKNNWKYAVGGGVIGAVLFGVYFYPFLIGGFLLAARLTVFRRWKYVYKESHFALRPALGVLAVAIVISLPYWLPAMWSIIASGFDHSRGGWHHLGSTGVAFAFLSFSIPGLLYLAGIYYALRRARAPVYRGLIVLTGAVIVFYFVGSILGALQRPVNLIKANEFIPVLSGAFIGLPLAGIIRRYWKRRYQKEAIGVIVSLILLFFLHNYNSLARHTMIKTARTAYVPTFGTVADEMEQRKGTTFLAIEEFYSFYPVYTFIAANEHYSHPASRFYDRFTFLRLLNDMADPYLTAVGFRHNIFDPIDYFMPRYYKDNYELYVSLSNYPDRLKTRTLRYTPSLFDDPRLFRRETGDNLYAVLPPPPDYPMRDFSAISSRDSLLFLAKTRVLMEYLDPAGDKLATDYAGADWADWRKVMPIGQFHRFGDEISLLSCDMATGRDSLYLFFAVRAERDIRPVYRMFLHIFPDDGSRMQNHDFKPEPETATWERGDMFVLMRAIPKPAVDFTFDAGFFVEDVRIGPSFKARVAVRP